MDRNLMDFSGIPRAGTHNLGVCTPSLVSTFSFFFFFLFSDDLQGGSLKISNKMLIASMSFRLTSP